MGIDLQESDGDYELEHFNLTIDDKIEFEYKGGTIFVQNNGNGFSDYVLQLFDISAFSGSSKAVFNLVYSDAQGAREQFFLIAAQQTTAEVPEPASVALLFSGISAAILRRRKKIVS